MKLSNVTTGLSKMTGRTGLVVQAHTPEILLAIGIAGTVASTVLACKATMKVEAVLENHAEKTEKIAECWEKVKDGEIPLDEYSETDHKKDLTVAYVQTAVDFVKLYGPAITLGAFSIACIIGSHGVMKKRNVALMAAYKAVEEGFAAYRKRVIDEYGEDKDYMYRHGLHEETVVKEVVDEDGKTKKVKKTVMATGDTNNLSIYARWFDESCKQWTKDPQYNQMFLHSVQNMFNNLLQTRGHVFLNEVYDALGIDRTQAGSVVGWVIGEGRDNFIDFGVFDGERERARAFVNGFERNILLDFNVDGVIYDLFTKNKA